MSEKLNAEQLRVLASNATDAAKTAALVAGGMTYVAASNIVRGFGRECLGASSVGDALRQVFGGGSDRKGKR